MINQIDETKFYSYKITSLGMVPIKQKSELETWKDRCQLLFQHLDPEDQDAELVDLCVELIEHELFEDETIGLLGRAVDARRLEINWSEPYDCI